MPLLRLFTPSIICLSCPSFHLFLFPTVLPAYMCGYSPSFFLVYYICLSVRQNRRKLPEIYCFESFLSLRYDIHVMLYGIWFENIYTKDKAFIIYKVRFDGGKSRKPCRCCWKHFICQWRTTDRNNLN